MVALTVIADSFPDWEAPLQEAAARDLTQAIAETAPRSCSARFVVAKDAEEPRFASPLIRSVRVPAAKRMLPVLWQSGASARPLDGEFVHAMTPLVPLRSHREDDGSQSTVLVSHDVAWELPELLPGAQAKLYRGLVRRAVRYADVILTPSHAMAKALHERYGEHLPVQVLPLAPPTILLEPDDAAERRAHFELPRDYLVTTAPSGEHGRLQWIVDALRADPALPPVVVIEGLDPQPDAKARAGAGATDLSHDERVIRIRPRELADVGAALSGAALLLVPQRYVGTGYTVLAALAAGVPVLHAGHPAVEELALDAGGSGTDAVEFGAALSRIMSDASELELLRVHALDRARSYSWHNTAWQLWETHANL